MYLFLNRDGETKLQKRNSTFQRFHNGTIASSWSNILKIKDYWLSSNFLSISNWKFASSKLKPQLTFTKSWKPICVYIDVGLGGGWAWSWLEIKLMESSHGLLCKNKQTQYNLIFIIKILNTVQKLQTISELESIKILRTDSD